VLLERERFFERAIGSMFAREREGNKGGWGF